MNRNEMKIEFGSDPRNESFARVGKEEGVGNFRPGGRFS